MIAQLGKFRAPEANETQAAYFKAAVLKAAGGKDMPPEHESTIQRFVSTVIGRASKDQDKIAEAYFYAVECFKAEGELFLCADEMLKKAA